MAIPVSLASGQHLLNDPVVHWEVHFSDTPQFPSVVLTASVQVGPTPPIFPTQGHTATTLAVQMNAVVAMELYEKLGELGRSMGWLPQK
jgi:hypothetical protein